MRYIKVLPQSIEIEKDWNIEEKRRRVELSNFVRKQAEWCFLPAKMLERFKRHKLPNDLNPPTPLLKAIKTCGLTASYIWRIPVQFLRSRTGTVNRARLSVVICRVELHVPFGCCSERSGGFPRLADRSILPGNFVKRLLDAYKWTRANKG